jgi:D-alanine--poly(phosphoribitol) ligase subunit 1
MMNLLERIQEYGSTHREKMAVYGKSRHITYSELVSASDRLAAYLGSLEGEKTPIMVYGHKDPYMLVCFLACVKAGRAYCPVDITVPLSRVEDIANTVDGPCVLATEDLELPGQNILGKTEIERIISQTTEVAPRDMWVKEEDVFYIIFTSGSTGRAKGVQITYANLLNYLEWASGLAAIQGEPSAVFLNQAPFSFDLSVMDLYNCLYTGASLWTIDKETQGNMGELMESLSKSGATVWVSTPSFADICLSNPEYDSKLLPSLNTFLFCGETLRVETATRLRERFPGARIFNLYGPTEATVSVTAVEVTEEMLKSGKPLPVGNDHPGTEVSIIREDGSLADEEERGEILITGNTVSPGYFKDPEKTREVFLPGNKYRTGDEGFLKDGMLHYCGRLDLQIKLHGYRIELGDIENNLMKLDHITGAAVLPKWKDEKIRSLTAFVAMDRMPEKESQASREIKEGMRDLVPDYMIPKKFVYLERLPVTANGKVDRKALEARL